MSKRNIRKPQGFNQDDLSGFIMITKQDISIALKQKKINTKTLEALTIADSLNNLLNDCVEVESQGFKILIELPTDSQSVGVK